MNELSLGIWLRRERERRGITLRQIAEQTKLGIRLLEGLEADDLSRWPTGIYRKSFVRSYATSVGLDADEVVKRFETEHPPQAEDAALPSAPAEPEASPSTPAAPHQTPRPRIAARTRVLGTAADLTVALVVAFGSAAAGSRLLWPVLFVAVYYALGVLLKGTSPMVALLSDDTDEPAADPRASADASDEAARAGRAQTPERRPASRRISRAQRASKGPRARVQ
jgi:transcriptional regulator with XRE-family HTH domain